MQSGRLAFVLSVLVSNVAFGAPQGACNCTADLNSDSVVNAADLSILLGAWAGSGSADLNGSGVVDAADLAIVLGQWGPCQAPTNDACADAIVLTSLSGDDNPYCTSGATTDGSDVPLPECLVAGSAQITNDIWYRFTAPIDGVMQVSTCGANYDSKIAVYKPGPFGSLCPGGVAGAVAHACNDDDQFDVCSSVFASNLYASMVADTTYVVRVGGFSGAVGKGSLDINTFAKGDSISTRSTRLLVAQANVR